MNATELKIRLYGDPALRGKSSPVRIIGAEERQLFDEMLKVMRNLGGIGLAASQLGINKQMIVAEVGSEFLKIANPKILKKIGTDVLEEGCLSIPGICLEIRRAKEVSVEGLNEFGERIELNLRGLLARVIQHETDHLSGRLIVDYANLPKKFLLRSKLNAIKRRYNEGVRQPEGKSCQLPM